MAKLTAQEFLALSMKERHERRAQGIHQLFASGTLEPGATQTLLSPSGRYELRTTSYKTGKSSWNVLRVDVVRVADDQLLVSTHCNYHSVCHLFVEDQPDGDWVLLTEDYQGQVGHNLTTGEAVYNVPDAVYRGHGFCWAQAKYHRSADIIEVRGCIWAGGYEVRLYDASCLAAGWPELVPVEPNSSIRQYIPDENTTVKVSPTAVAITEHTRVYRATGETEGDIERAWSTFYRKKTQLETQGGSPEELEQAEADLRAHEQRYPELFLDSDEDEDESEPWLQPVPYRFRVFRIVDFKLVPRYTWLSRARKEQDEANRIATERRHAQWAEWKANDPCFTALAASVEPVPKVGWTYPSAMEGWKGEPNKAFFRVECPVDIHHDRQATLSWGVDEGEVKLTLWVRGKGDVAEMKFDRTAEGVLEAWWLGWKHCMRELPAPLDMETP